MPAAPPDQPTSRPFATPPTSSPRRCRLRRRRRSVPWGCRVAHRAAARLPPRCWPRRSARAA
ncbi:hypothetical protein C6A85_08380, partial [Mycobacterium sp. ITM-2017-0098]